MVLRSFRLGNHRSFRDEHELLLMPAYDKTRPVVPVAAIYGANAAGKSNLLDGLRFMAEAVRDSYRSWHPEGGVPRSPYQLDPAADDPSVFVADVVVGGVRQVYGFVVDDERVREEWLYAYPRSRRRVLFERGDDGVSFGSTVSGQRSRKTELLAELTRPNALFLSLAAQVGQPDLLPAYHWFAGSPGTLRFVDGFAGRDLGKVTTQVARLLERDPSSKRLLLDLLAAADFGITDIHVEQIEQVTPSQFRVARRLVGLGSGEGSFRTQEVLRRFIEENPFPLRDGSAAYRVPTSAEVADLPEIGSTRLRFAHGAGGVLLDLADESAGTHAWLSVLPAALSALEGGATLVVDEIDTSLHPRLTSSLIRLFRSEANPHGAQLLFTTHDATLLGTTFGDDVLDRDQVWFVEKDSDGASRLYPLTDFYPRKGENTERRYLVGSYGGVPPDSDLASRVLAVREHGEAIGAGAS